MISTASQTLQHAGEVKMVSHSFCNREELVRSQSSAPMNKDRELKHYIERLLDYPFSGGHARECRWLSDHKGEYTEDDCSCGLMELEEELKEYFNN